MYARGRPGLRPYWLALLAAGGRHLSARLPLAVAATARPLRQQRHPSRAYLPRVGAGSVRHQRLLAPADAGLVGRQRCLPAWAVRRRHRAIAVARPGCTPDAIACRRLALL